MQLPGAKPREKQDARGRSRTDALEIEVGRAMTKSRMTNHEQRPKSGKLDLSPSRLP